MTNEQIVSNMRFLLLEQGLLKSTGRKIRVMTEDGEKEMPEPEPIHTFMGWLATGYRVKRGEKSRISFEIWKPVKEKKKEKETEEKRNGGEEEKKMILVKAHWFTSEQVERV